MLSPLEESINACPPESPILSNLQMINRNAHRLLKLVNTLLQFSRIESDRFEAQFRETDIVKYTMELASSFESMAESLKLEYVIQISKASQSRSYEGTGIGLALVKELVLRHDGEISVHSEVNKGTTFRVSLPTGWAHLPEKQVYFEDNEHEINSMEKCLFNGRDLYLEESHQWIQNDPDSEPDLTNDDNADDAIDLDCLDTFKNSVSESKKADIQNIIFPSLYDDVSNAHKFIYHILVVDDNTDMRNYLYGLLQKEFKVYSACDGRDALKILRKLQKLPDLILSDVMMPNMNGLELLKTLRSNPVTQLIPMIFLSAKADEDASVEGLEQGADDYLIKPFSIKDLIVRIKANIKLSHLRQQLLLQQKQQSETRELLFSISDKIRSGLNIEKTLSMAIEEICRILSCERIFLIKIDSTNSGEGRIVAFSASDPNEQNLAGRSVPYSFNNEKDIQKLFLKYNITDTGSEAVGKLQDVLMNNNEYIVMENSYSRAVGRHASIIAMPIKTNSSAWGWIVVNRAPNRTWLDSEKVFIQQISNQIGLAITHAILMEEKLKKEAQMEAAKAANEAKGQILANTSHELRTPLGAIIGLLSAFENTPLTKDQKEMVQIMTRASDVVLSVINNILDVANLEAQKITLINRNFDLLQIPIGMDNYSMHDITFDEALFNKDPITRLQQVLINLLSNSIKFTKTGEIVLRVLMASSDESMIKDSTKKNTIYVELIDTGVGIDPKFMKYIWESFSQADATITRPQDGTGLGLSICKHLVSMNGGKLGVTSELGKGSRFWFTWIVELLPVNQSNLVFPLNARSKRVLVIDPIHVARNTLAKLIGSHVKQVDAFGTVEESIASAKMWKEQHDEIYDLPIMSGYDASRVIRAMKSPVSQIPIIALTASAIQGSREKCLESGMNDFLTKPLKIPQLKETLNKWLED
ncbi:3017_t:CDS:10, partial [Acaulospora colombiana]